VSRSRSRAPLYLVPFALVFGAISGATASVREVLEWRRYARKVRSCPHLWNRSETLSAAAIDLKTQIGSDGLEPRPDRLSWRCQRCGLVLEVPEGRWPIDGFRGAYAETEREVPRRETLIPCGPTPDVWGVIEDQDARRDKVPGGNLRK
jgi:hypothetical protein